MVYLITIALLASVKNLVIVNEIVHILYTPLWRIYIFDIQYCCRTCTILFKPGARQPMAGASGFLKLILCGLSICACVCLHVCSEAINN